jgi:O-antigen ligase/lipoprotein NlpI
LGYTVIAGISLFFSINLADGVFEWTKIFLFFSFLVFSSVYFQKEENLIDITSKSIGALSLIINMIGLYQFYWLASHEGVTHKTTYFIDGTFTNRNLFAEILLLTLPFVIFGALRFKLYWKAICYFSMFSSLFLITATLTRAVWLGLFISFVLTFLLLLLLKIKKTENTFSLNFRKLIIPFAIVIFSIAAAVFFYSRLDSGETFEKQISAISNIKLGGANERVELWKKSMQLINDKPITGVGLASWKIEVLKFNVKGTKPEDAATFYQYPHNDFIMVAAETGIIGLLFYSLMFITVIYYIIIILKNTSASEKLFYLLIFSGIISFCVISLFSFPKERIEQNTFLIFIIVPVVLKYHKIKGVNQKKKSSDSGITLLVSLLFFITICFSLFLGTERIKSDVHVLKALSAKNKANWREVINQVNKAKSPYYTMDPMSTPLLWYRGTANFNLGNQNEAFKDFKSAYEINPYHIHILNNLGTCYELNKDHNAAIEYFNKALAINPTLEDAILNLSAAYFNSGKIDSAYQTIRKCDIHTTNERYKTSVPVIVTAKFQLIKRLTETDPLSEKLISDQKNWISRIKNFPKLSDQEFQKLYKATVRSKIFDFLNDPAWMTKIHAKSVENNISLEEQAFIDSYFLVNNIKL